MNLFSDGMVHGEPSAQAAVDLIPHWIAKFPKHTGIRTNGYASPFDDSGMPWIIERLGGIADADVLELGPLEGAHTYLLARAGAKSVTAIEANKRAYVKCLITKEVMGLKNASFLLGNFLPWLESTEKRFDVIWASGVLYHMTEPLKLLSLIAARTDRLFLWTHYFTDGGNPWRPPFIGTRTVEFAGREIKHFNRLYLRPRWRPLACGGVRPYSSWLRRDDILFALGAVGFNRIETAFEDRVIPHRHSFVVVAVRS